MQRERFSKNHVMLLISGPNLNAGPPAPSEKDWIFNCLQDPQLYLPLSLRRPPTREEFDAGEIELVEEDGPSYEAVTYFIIRKRKTQEPWGFYLEFGWDGPFDTTREFDIAVPKDQQGSLRLLLEAHIIGAQSVFVNKLAKRIRWRVNVPGKSPPRWYSRIGARCIGSITEPHPVTKQELTKHIYELTRRELEALFKKRGFDLSVDFSQEEKTFGIYFVNSQTQQRVCSTS